MLRALTAGLVIVAAPFELLVVGAAAVAVVAIVAVTASK